MNKNHKNIFCIYCHLFLKDIKINKYFISRFERRFYRYFTKILNENTDHIQHRIVHACHVNK